MPLEKFGSSFTFKYAAHLIRRTTFSVDKQTIDAAMAFGLDGAISKLFEDLPAPDPPKRYMNSLPDDHCEVGADWTIKPMTNEKEVTNRNNSLWAWQWLNLVNSGFNLKEKMVMFWMNHFGVGNTPDPRANYQYIRMLRSHAQHDFRNVYGSILEDWFSADMGMVKNIFFPGYSKISMLQKL